MTHHESRPDAPPAPTEATGSAPWLYACPSCCAQSTTTIYVGPTWQQPLRKQHRNGCKSVHKVLIGQVGQLTAAQLRASRNVAPDQNAFLVQLVQRSEAAARQITAAIRALNGAADPDDLFLSSVRERLQLAGQLLTGDVDHLQLQQPGRDVDISEAIDTLPGRVRNLAPAALASLRAAVECAPWHTDEQEQQQVPRLVSVVDRARFAITDAGRAALAAGGDL